MRWQIGAVEQRRPMQGCIILSCRGLRAVPNKRKRLVELTFPSVFGYEKVAMAAVAAFARRHGIAGERINDLCTAVAEACVNAIEYGNAANAHVPVTVRFSVDGQRLIVEVCDQALGATRPAMGSMVDLDHPP